MALPPTPSLSSYHLSNASSSSPCCTSDLSFPAEQHGPILSPQGNDTQIRALRRPGLLEQDISGFSQNPFLPCVVFTNAFGQVTRKTPNNNVLSSRNELSFSSPRLILVAASSGYNYWRWCVPKWRRTSIWLHVGLRHARLMF